MASLLLQTVIYIQRNSSEGKCFPSYWALPCDQNEKLCALFYFLQAVLASFTYWQGWEGICLKSITHFVLVAIRKGIHWVLGNWNRQGGKKEFTHGGHSVWTLTHFASRKCIMSKIFYSVFSEKSKKFTHPLHQPQQRYNFMVTGPCLWHHLWVIWLHIESHLFWKLDCMQTLTGTLRWPVKAMPSDALVQV